jgi:hypothetical protein
MKGRAFRWCYGWAMEATRPGMLVAIALCSLGLSLAWPSGARAEASRAQACVDKLDDAAVDELLVFTERSFADQRLGAALWYSGWLAFNSTIVSVGAWKAATAEKHLERDVWMLSSIGAGIFVLGAVIMPLPGLYANLRMSRMSEASPAQRKAKLRRALRLLEAAADGEDRNSNLVAHLGALFYGLFSAGFLYFHNPRAPGRDVAVAASVQLIATVAGAEATLWSVPRKARRDLAAVDKRACGRPGGDRSEAAARTLSLSFSPISLGLRWRF